MTTKTSRNFETFLGLFNYIHLPLPYYAFGINMVKLTSEQYAMIASLEKAICDKIINTSGLILRSVSSAGSYLIDNPRIDEDVLKGLNTQIINEWISDAPKKESLQMIIKFIESL